MESIAEVSPFFGITVLRYLSIQPENIIRQNRKLVEFFEKGIISMAPQINKKSANKLLDFHSQMKRCIPAYRETLM